MKTEVIINDLKICTGQTRINIIIKVLIVNMSKV